MGGVVFRAAFTTNAIVIWGVGPEISTLILGTGISKRWSTPAGTQIIQSINLGADTASVKRRRKRANLAQRSSSSEEVNIDMRSK